MNATSSATPGVLRVACLQASDLGVLTKYDRTEPIYLPQSVAIYIYLHPVYTLFTVSYRTILLHITYLFLVSN
jgi:hypothetical protein